MLDRKFEKFKGGPAIYGSPEVRVTLNRRGCFYLNKKAYEALGSPKAVALYYSREDDAIAIENAYERTSEHFPVKKRVQGGWSIHASTFCRHYNILLPNTQRFLRPDVDNEGNLILNLRETVTVGGIVKRKTPAGDGAQSRATTVSYSP